MVEVKLWEVAAAMEGGVICSLWRGGKFWDNCVFLIYLFLSFISLSSKIVIVFFIYLLSFHCF